MIEIERDSDLRGYWVKGLREIQDWAVNAMLCKEIYKKQIFIPDSLIRKLGYKKNERNK